MYADDRTILNRKCQVRNPPSLLTYADKKGSYYLSILRRSILISFTFFRLSDFVTQMVCYFYIHGWLNKLFLKQRFSFGLGYYVYLLHATYESGLET